MTSERTPDEAADLATLLRQTLAHDLATKAGPGQHISGDYVFNKDGSKAHAPNCRGCRVEAEITRLTQERDDLQREAGALAKRMVAAERALAESEKWDECTRTAWDEEVSRRIAAERALAETRKTLLIVKHHPTTTQEVASYIVRALAASAPQEPQS